MSLWKKIKSSFEEKPGLSSETPRHLFNYRRIWRSVVVLTGGVALIPLVFITAIDYKVTQHSIESEFILRTTRIVSNTRRAISFFLSERKSALEFIVHDNTFQTINHPKRLSVILENLKKSFGGGFVDLGVIDSSGLQKNYVGPYELEGKNYREQDWYNQVVDHGVHISDVFLGYRKVPHMVIAVKRVVPSGSFYMLRAAIGIAPFEELLSNLELGGMGDAFMINHEGILQTPSRYYGKGLDKVSLPIPSYSPRTEVFEWKNPGGQDLVIGYRFIDNTPFILMIVKNKHELMKPWFRTRLKLFAFLIVSVTVILMVILGTVTFMVKKIKTADQKRVMTFHEMEYANKMASIGRLAASVAHEINNPLAIINEKAGLIKDLFTYKEEYAQDHKLDNLIDGILRSVKRSATITKRLLTFARNLQAEIEPIRLKEIIEEVLLFQEKEAELRGITITLDIAEDIPLFKSDRGKIQQIFLNIINNAFAALSDGGHLEIEAKLKGKDAVSIDFTDHGCGIPPEDLDHVFEPFFSTKKSQGGTGLGLSITYNLVQEIGGRIGVTSELDKGTRFTVTLPLKMERRERDIHESIIGGR